MARIGTVGYLNARPLSDHVDIDRHTLVLAHPAEVARMLRDREVDVALVPVAAVLAEPGYKIVPGFCIGSEGPVSSVVIAAETPPEQWTKVVLDGVSRTSVILARLLLAHGPLAERVRPGLDIVQGAPNSALAAAKKTVAGVLIGDAARQLPARLTTRIDLASEWREWTGLPFVFAVWAGRPDLDPAVVRHLAEVGAKGVARLRESHVGEDLRYLTENLRYPLDDRALVGLRRFASLATNAGLLPSDAFELYGPERERARPDVDGLLARALDGGALPMGEILALLRYAPVADLAAAADLKRRERYPGDDVPYRIDVPHDGDVRAAMVAGAVRVRLGGPVTAERVRAVARAFPGIAIEGGKPVGRGSGAVGGRWSDPSERGAGGVAVRPGAGLGRRGVGVGVAGVGRARGPGGARSGSDAGGRAGRDRRGARGDVAPAPGPAGAGLGAGLGGGGRRGPLGSVANTATDHLRALTLARLVLPAAVRVVASSETEGLGIAQASLRAGCDHAGAILLDGDPAGWAARIDALEHNVAEAGFRPMRERLGLRPPVGISRAVPAPAN